jgi:hypothetical protein
MSRKMQMGAASHSPNTEPTGGVDLLTVQGNERSIRKRTNTFSIVLGRRITRLVLCLASTLQFYNVSTCVSQHVRVPENWDLKYRECAPEGLSDSSEVTPACSYNYCNLTNELVTICLYPTVESYYTSFGEVGQDCVSYKLLEDYVLSGESASQGYVDTLCSSNAQLLNYSKQSLYVKDWDYRYIDGLARFVGLPCARREAILIGTKGTKDEWRNECWLPSYLYCDERATPFLTICSMKDKELFLLSGGVVGQDCATYRLVSDVLLGSYNYTEHSLLSYCVNVKSDKSATLNSSNRELVTMRAGCQEDTSANPGAYYKLTGGYDLTTFSTTLTKRTGYYSDFHLHFHNTASVSGVSPNGGALTGCSLCHSLGTEWDRPLWVLTGTALSITRDLKVAWVYGGKMSLSPEVTTSFPHIRVAGTFTGTIYVKDSVRVTPTVTNECGYTVSSGSTTVVGNARACVITLRMTTFSTEAVNEFRPICGCTRNEPPFNEVC